MLLEYLFKLNQAENREKLSLFVLNPEQIFGLDFWSGPTMSQTLLRFYFFIKEKKNYNSNLVFINLSIYLKYNNRYIIKQLHKT